VLLLTVPWLMNADASTTAVQELDARQTVVIANRLVPESIELARHYMQGRNIPSNHLCIVELPAGEVMSRWNFEHKLRDPLQAFLREQKLVEQVRRDEKNLNPHENPWRTVKHQVRYLVSMYGVPIRIAETRPYLLAKIARLTEDSFQRDGAATDSELACLLWDSYEIKGLQPNPHYNMVHIGRGQRTTRPVLIAARLDGPDPASVRNMIDVTLATESHGLYGRAYIDFRQVRDPDYYLGDFWLKEAGMRLSRAGYDVVYDNKDSLFPPDYPMSDAAFYFGWYTEHVSGALAGKNFRFRPGAIAYHLHSASAKTLRSTTAQWAGPLIAAGAVAVMGAVDEPFLPFTPDLQVFSDRLASGYSYGESACFALRALSWQITVIGDPLYRPFVRSFEEQLTSLEESGHPDLEWLLVRRMNFYLEQQQFNGREAARRTGSLLIREKLADLYSKNDLWNDAINEYQQILAKAENDVAAIRVGYRLVLILRLLNRADEAQRAEVAIRERWSGSPYLSHLDGAVP